MSCKHQILVTLYLAKMSVAKTELGFHLSFPTVLDNRTWMFLDKIKRVVTISHFAGFSLFVQGDSGGPLVGRVNKHGYEDKAVLVGIASRSLVFSDCQSSEVGTMLCLRMYCRRS